AVRNRALWKALREQLGPVIDGLCSLPPAEAWRGDLLRGLVAYVDPGTALDPGMTRRFAGAIGQVADEAARTRLKAVEGALVARGRATEEAVELIRRRDHVRLRDLKAAILDDLGDAIAPLVRAAVYLAIWSGDPTYDPLPDLGRIPTGE